MAAKDAVEQAAKNAVQVKRDAQRAVWILTIRGGAVDNAAALVDEIYEAGVRKGYRR
jgi:hypothetical protein